MLEPRWHAVNNAKAKIHIRIDLDGLHYRPSDDVRERDLAVALSGEMLIEDTAIFFENLDWDRSRAGRRRNRQAQLHILDDLFGYAGDGLWLGVGGERNSNRSFHRGGFRSRLSRRSGRLSVRRGFGRHSAIQQITKISLPRLINELRVGLVSLKQTIDIRRV